MDTVCFDAGSAESNPPVDQHPEIGEGQPIRSVITDAAGSTEFRNGHIGIRFAYCLQIKCDSQAGMHENAGVFGIAVISIVEQQIFRWHVQGFGVSPAVGYTGPEPVVGIGAGCKLPAVG